MSKFSVLFVCTENICRSPLAQGMFQAHLKRVGLHRKVSVESAGTFCSHSGHRPDARSVKVAKEAGVKLRGIKARRIEPEDFERFDLILPMDAANKADLMKICPSDLSGKIQLIMSFASSSALTEVPDPYYGNYIGFQNVHRLLDEALDGLLNEVQSLV